MRKPPEAAAEDTQVQLSSPQQAVHSSSGDTAAGSVLSLQKDTLHPADGLPLWLQEAQGKAVPTAAAMSLSMKKRENGFVRTGDSSLKQRGLLFYKN